MKPLVTQKKLTKIMVILVLLLGLLPIGGTVFAAHEVYINEIQVSTASTDWEFFELQGAAGTDLSDLTLIGVESDNGTSAGSIDLVISLAGQSIPADGFWLGISPTGASTYGVTGDLSINDNSFENSTATYFLVSNFTGSAGDDLDGDNNGTLDSMSWNEIVDSINIRDGDASDFDYGAPSVGPDGTFLPSGTYRCPDAPAGTFGSNFLNFSTPDGTPGESNNPTCGIVETAVYINEIQVSTSGADWEFFELQSESGTDLSDLTLVGVESDAGTSAGTIDTVISLAGQTVPADGFWVGISPSGVSAYGVTGDLSIADNSFENSTATYFLVRNFSGSQGADLDGDDDGTLDNMPWDEIIDSINIRDAGASDFDYGAPSVGPDGTFLPSGTYRCPDAPDGTFGSNILNFGTPDGTPGESNNPTCGIVSAAVYINEIQVSTTGSDWEFFELQSEPGADLSDLTLVGIESDTGTSAGTIDTVISLAGQTIPSDSFWLGISPTGASTYGVTGDLSIGDNSFENSTATYFLVRNFSGSQGADLDGDDDGTLDSMPWDEIVDSINLRDSASDFDYGAPSVGPDGSFLPSGTYRCPDAPDGSFTEIHNFGTPDGTPGEANDCGGPVVVEAKIHEVQGSGNTVAITDPVILQAVVVADYQAGDQLSGFFIQEEDTDVDADAATSEGILVFCGGCSTDVAVGDLVDVIGLPGEYFGMSQIDVTSGSVAVVSSGHPMPTPATIDLPAAGSTRSETTLESFEGMLVTFTDTLYVSEYFELARYGQLVMTADARPQQFTDAFEPSVAGYNAFLDDLNSKRIILDDDNNIQNDALGSSPAEDEPYFWPRPGLSNSNFIRGGDSIANLTGVLHWSWAGFGGTDAWRLRPVEGVDYTFTSNNLRPSAPDTVGGNLKVASFNVLNYFTTIDSRGADSLAELDRQREKTAAAICALNADVVGLIEIENNSPIAISNLLDGPNGINANCGPYTFIDTGVIGTDAIAVAFIYKTDKAEAIGDFAVLDSSADARFIDTKNRPALAQTFMDKDTGGILTVVVNHLKSKGSDCLDVGDPDLGDGSANCNGTRTLAAEAMVDWLATDPTGSGDADFLIIGDLNSYRNEDPIDAIEEGADDTVGTDDDYTDLLDSFLGGSAYTYLFDGQLGYLDHALANSDLLGEVAGVTVWHINADEIPVFDYNDDIDDGGAEASFERESTSLPIYEPNAYRSSDHDPVLVGLNVCDEIAPTFLEISLSPDELWPANHKYVEVTATVIATDNFDTDLEIELISVSSDEPDDGLGDGDTPDDIVIVDDFHFMLRAERGATNQAGRTYTVTYMVTDDCGNSATGTATVFVPFSKGN